MKSHNVLFVYRYKQIIELIKNISSSEYPKEFLYGMDGLLGMKDYDINYINVNRGIRNTIFRKLCFLFETPFATFVRLGIPLEIYKENKKLIDSQGIIICVNDAIGFGILFYKMLGFIDCKVIALMMSLPERLKYFKNNKLLISFISKLLSRADLILTLSDYAQKPLIDDFNIPKEKLKTFYFGADVDYWNPTPTIERENFILSIGNDINRDYKTLIKAIPEDMELIIVTSKNIDIKGKKNIKIISGISDNDLKKLYLTCKLTVVPSIKIDFESSGLSCTVQAMASGSPVLISDAPTMREYFTENEHINYYEPENSKSLKNKILDILENYKFALECAEKARILINSKFNSKNMALNMSKIIRTIENQN